MCGYQRGIVWIIKSPADNRFSLEERETFRGCGADCSRSELHGSMGTVMGLPDPSH